MSKELKVLYQKVEDFFDEVRKRHPEGLSCKSGCSTCCHVDLSVFSVEANNIESWFQSLSQEDKEKIREEWEKPSTQTRGFNGELLNSCAFLKDHRCTIYEARPLICRTQGLPLMFEKDHGGEDVDACPLNFEDSELEEKDILSLARLNRVLSQLQIQAGTQPERVELRKLMEKLKGH
jgi:uncharacterized protein